MLRATRVIPAAEAPATAPADRVILDHDARHRRRIRLHGEAGLTFLLDLAEATLLRDGDRLLLEDGRTVAVSAAPEPVVDIFCGDPLHTARIAWHLGNRHWPTQLLADRLRIRADHVIVDMLRRLGATVVECEAPFDPEGGAYAGESAPGHGHGHSHDHGHEHDHGHGHAQGQANGHSHA